MADVATASTVSGSMALAEQKWAKTSIVACARAIPASPQPARWLLRPSPMRTAS